MLKKIYFLSALCIIITLPTVHAATTTKSWAYGAPTVAWCRTNYQQLLIGAGTATALCMCASAFIAYNKKRAFKNRWLAASRQPASLKKKISGYTGAYEADADILMTGITSNYTAFTDAHASGPIALTGNRHVLEAFNKYKSSHPIALDLAYITRTGAFTRESLVQDALTQLTQELIESPDQLRTEQDEKESKARAAEAHPGEVEHFCSTAHAYSFFDKKFAKEVQDKLVQSKLIQQPGEIVLVRYSNGDDRYFLHPTDLAALNALNEDHVFQLYTLHNAQPSPVDAQMLTLPRHPYIVTPRIVLPLPVWNTVKLHHKNRLNNQNLIFISRPKLTTQQIATVCVALTSLYITWVIFKFLRRSGGKIVNAMEMSGQAALLATGKTLELLV